jgi:hypothetical protein
MTGCACFVKLARRIAVLESGVTTTRFGQKICRISAPMPTGAFVIFRKFDARAMHIDDDGADGPAS